jgi:uncharacterized protein (UPF0333 family)
MLKLLKQRKAQTTLEYAILIGVIVAGLIAMQIYLKRGWQGKLRDSADSMGEQFSPGHTTYHYVTNSTSNSTENSTFGATHTNIIAQNTTKTGNEHVEAEGGEKWW